MKPSAVATVILLALGMALFVAAENLIPATCANFPGDQSACQAILNETDLSLNDKKDLFAELWIANTLVPNHAAVYTWDNDLPVGSPPNGTQQQSNALIKNAWVRFLYVLPAVFDKGEGRWYFAPTVSTKVKYDYDLIPPTGTEPGDCQTTYSVTNDNAYVGIKRNGTPVASGITASFATLPGTNNLTAELTVTATLVVTHYNLVTHCVAQDPNTGACTQTTTTCQSVGSEDRDYALTTQDAFNGFRQDFSHLLEFNYEDLNGLRQAHIQFASVGPPNELIVDFNGASYSISETAYGIKRRLDPYDYLYVERNQKQNKTKTGGIVELGFKREVSGSNYSYDILLGLDKKPSACTLKVMSDFNETDESDKCLFTPLVPTRLTMSLDKLDYDFEEPMAINANLSTESGAPVSGRTITLKFGEKTASTATNADGNALFLVAAAKDSFGLVQASFDSDGSYASAKAAKRAVLRTKANWDLAVVVAGYFAVNIMIFLLIQKYLGEWMK